MPQPESRQEWPEEAWDQEKELLRHILEGLSAGLRKGNGREDSSEAEPQHAQGSYSPSPRHLESSAYLSRSAKLLTMNAYKSKITRV